MIKRVCTMVWILSGLVAAAFAQTNIQGIVIDENAQPLSGVSVAIKGSQRMAQTDNKGQFMLFLPADGTLVFSYVGYKTTALPVKAGQTQMQVQLFPDENMLQEVQVSIGYQTIRKSDVTGAISSVKATELALSSPTIGQALVGKVSGVQVSQVSGAPYVGTKIRVRGVGSINASSDPLYVIDGYPAGNNVYVNPEDIESIDILKDAASAAIYGSRAAGGVVLITTKRGKEGAGKFEYNVQGGFGQLEKKVKLLNARDFIQLQIDGRNNTYRDLVINAGKPWNDTMFGDDNTTRVANVGNAGSIILPPDIYDFSTQTAKDPMYDTDWQDELYENAPFMRHNLSFTGGTDKARYFLSGAYQDQNGIVMNTGQKTVNFRANVDGTIGSKMKVGANLSFTNNNNKEVGEGRYNNSPMMSALLYLPYLPARDADGNPIKYQMAGMSADNYGVQNPENPLATMNEVTDKRSGRRGTYNMYASYEILKDLVFKFNGGIQTYNEKYDYYLPTSLSKDNNPPGSPLAISGAYALANTQSYLDQLGEFTLTYNKQIGKHKLDLLGGYTVQKTSDDYISIKANGFQNDNIGEITDHGADPSNISLQNSGDNKTLKDVYTLVSYLGRASYNYDSRYFLSASFRTDGSSRFGRLNRWGNFPSVSAGWTLSNEDFYNNWLGDQSSLKLRASWGLSGNNNIGNYNSQQTFNSPGGVVFGNGQIVTGMWPGDIKDPELGWESTSQYNFGTDISVFHGRLFVIANYYLSYSYDLLFNQPISAISGTSTVLTNLRDSKISNKGFDFQLDGQLVQHTDFNLGMSGNITFNKNKVLDLGGASTIITAGAERSYLTHITEEGQPVGMFYGFKVLGVVTPENVDKVAPSAASTNPLQPGDLYFEDVDGNGIVNDADKQVIGSPHPDFTYGLALNARYKAVDFNASFNGSQGNQVLDGQDYYLYNMEGSGNQYADVADRFRSLSQPGNGKVYRASRGGTQSNSTRLSTFYLQDGSYFRCTNITLGYRLPMVPLQRAGISSARIFASVNNAFTITKYKGYNPEVDYSNGSNLTPGVDYGMYPLVRGYNLGVQLSF